MKVKVPELRKIVEDIVSEASKSKKKKGSPSVIDPPEAAPRPVQYKYANVYDFSEPLGKENRYRGQGQAAWGPQTSVHGDDLNDQESKAKKPFGYNEAHEFMDAIVNEEQGSSAWDSLVEESEPVGIWETLDRVVEKRVGFKKLKGKLSRERSVKDPAALAASIGRKKLGSKEMARRSAAGRGK